MKDQYFGDVNDYRKYGLLRTVAAAGLSIGVCWLLTGVDNGNDGELRRYLEKPSRWRKYDPDLYDRLQRVRQPDVQRGVRYCGEWGLVPGALYFDELLSDDSRQRDDYFRRALGTLGGCDVIFFDPDVGIEVPSTARGKRGSSQYIYWAELREAYRRGHSLLVYQHFPRVERTRFVPFLADCLGDELGAPRVGAFVTPYVVFFLVQQSVHGAALENAAAAVPAKWHGQINVWPPIPAAV
jgi:hypothetical protein